MIYELWQRNSSIKFLISFNIASFFFCSVQQRRWESKKYNSLMDGWRDKHSVYWVWTVVDRARGKGRHKRGIIIYEPVNNTGETRSEWCWMNENFVMFFSIDAPQFIKNPMVFHFYACWFSYIQSNAVRKKKTLSIDVEFPQLSAGWRRNGNILVELISSYCYYSKRSIANGNYCYVWECAWACACVFASPSTKWLIRPLMAQWPIQCWLSLRGRPRAYCSFL